MAKIRFVNGFHALELLLAKSKLHIAEVLYLANNKGWSYDRPAYYTTINKVIFGLVIVPVARKDKPVEVNVPEEKDSVGNFFQIKTCTPASQ